MTSSENSDLTATIGANLPYLRRYARALTGSQQRGDAYAVATIEAILGDDSLMDASLDPKTALFRVFHTIWTSSGATLDVEDTGLAAKAQEHLSRLTSGTREALLLHTIEDMTLDQVAQVLDMSADDAQGLVDIAYAEMSKSVAGKIMIIEDEAIIAMDLEAIISSMGHRATGVARTAQGARDLFARETPDLILSDIQLADDSSGIDAVNDILKKDPDVPVIYITAHPERLLSGQGSEPAFLIAKPYTEDQVRSAVSQAMFFSSTETLGA